MLRHLWICHSTGLRNLGTIPCPLMVAKFLPLQYHLNNLIVLSLKFLRKTSKKLQKYNRCMVIKISLLHDKQAKIPNFICITKFKCKQENSQNYNHNKLSLKTNSRACLSLVQKYYCAALKALSGWRLTH